jgi:hypothetical protein
MCKVWLVTESSVGLGRGNVETPLVAGDRVVASGPTWLEVIASHAKVQESRIPINEKTGIEAPIMSYEITRPWWRVVDTTAREPEPDTPVATTLPKALSWPID